MLKSLLQPSLGNVKIKGRTKGMAPRDRISSKPETMDTSRIIREDTSATFTPIKMVTKALTPLEFLL
jgi:hypothetical protein